MRIWKYRLEITDTQVLKVPCDSRFLTLQMQGNTPCIWVQVPVSSDSVNLLEEITINIYGTGHDMPEHPGVYLGTFQKGAFVGHAYEV